MTDSREEADKYQLQPEMPVASSNGAPQSTEQSTGSMVREIVETIVLALILFLVIRLVVQNYRIESHSMEPNFYEGQFVLVNKLAYKLGEPERGNVVVFHNPNDIGESWFHNTWCTVVGLYNSNCIVDYGEDYIKRIIGLPGDTIQVIGNTILVNDEELPQPFTYNFDSENSFYGPIVVPDDHIFVMGDNRPRSSDSRAFGPVSEDLIVGQAWLRVWPFNEFGFVKHYNLTPGEIVVDE